VPTGGSPKPVVLYNHRWFNQTSANNGQICLKIRQVSPMAV